ncbi:MAG: GHKL domain-containing protein [Eubacterium sp.]|nr:GHKL domain-containing protein [Eubacterium sp.]
MLKVMAYALFEFFIEFIKLFPIMYIVLQFKTKRLKKVIVYFAAALVLTCALSLSPANEIVPVSSFICVIMTIFILKGKMKTAYTIITYLGICMLDMLSASVMLLFVNYDTDALAENKSANLISNSISIIIIAAIIIVSTLYKKYERYNSEKRVSIFYLFLILLGEISISIFITVFQVVESDNKILSVTLCIGSIIFLILCVVMMINYMSKNHYKNISEINEKLLKSQENYYTMLLQKDKDTIKFRHDTAEHINCMYTLFERGKYDDLREYFNKIGASLSELRPKIQTGNDMLSAILNDSVNRYPSVEYEIEGKMPSETALSNMDICTIFSNLFDNAFSAAAKSERKLVTVSFRFIGENFFCKVMNTVDRKVNVENNTLVTEKNDKLNHGHGTYNARMCTEKNNGEITYSCDEKFFSAELVFPKI